MLSLGGMGFLAWMDVSNRFQSTVLITILNFSSKQEMCRPGIWHRPVLWQNQIISRKMSPREDFHPCKQHGSDGTSAATTSFRPVLIFSFLYALSDSMRKTWSIESWNCNGWKRPLGAPSPSIPIGQLTNVTKCHIHMVFKFLQGWQLNTFHEETAPNIQPTHPHMQHEAFTLILSLVTGEKSPTPTWLHPPVWEWWFLHLQRTCREMVIPI